MSTGIFVGSPVRELFGRRESHADPVAPPREAVLAGKRNDSIDVIRLFAAAGIVFVHAAQSKFFDNWGNLFRFGVPFFLFASFYYQSLSLQRHSDRKLSEFAASRFKRLYLPFLVWSGIYLVVRDVKHVTLLHLPLVQLHPTMLWAGTEYHLWFLPYLMAWSIVLALIHRMLLNRHQSIRWIVIALTVAAGCAIARAGVPAVPAYMAPTFESPMYTQVQWWLALPATFWALAFALLTTMSPVIFAVSPLIGFAGIALTVFCSFKQVYHGIQLTPRGLTGLGAMLAALVPWRGAAVSAMARIGRYSYGIYLCHVLAVEIIHVIEARMDLPMSAPVDLVTFVLSFAASIGIVLTLAKFPRLAWLNG